MSITSQESPVEYNVKASLEALEALKQYPNWVIWRYEERNGKRTKPLYNPLTLRKASTTDPTTWTSYNRALEAYEANKDKFNGIGFNFSGTPYTGIDYDHCIDPETKQIDEWATTIITALNSYAEPSPSEEGIHSIIEGHVPVAINRKLEGMRHPDAKIEIYSEERYFTFTGKHLGTQQTIEPRQGILDSVYAVYSSKTTKIEKELEDEKRDESISYTDDKILQFARQAGNSAKFIALYDYGIADDHSRADASLCCLLAFWTDKDGLQMDRLFRRSALFREKWDVPATTGGEQTYGELTIEKAIDWCNSSFKSKTEVTDTLLSPSSGRISLIYGDQWNIKKKEILEVIAEAHKADPKMFMHMSMVAKIAIDEDQRPYVMQMSIAALRNELAAMADFYKKEVDRQGKATLRNTMPPKEWAELLLALEPAAWPLNSLKAIVEAPVLRPDGSILDKPGYDESTKLYYFPSPGMEKCKIPNNPTKKDAMAAMEFLRPIFADFPWESEADRANAFGLLFTPFIRYAIKKDIQMALIDATNAGTGKGLICIIVSIAATGAVTTPMTAKKDDEEWLKSILTELIQGPRIVIIDNIRGVLESATIEAVLTGGGINGRILGLSKNAKPKNEATWMATGNNLLIGGDLARRCYRIRLISQTATPEERDDFVIEDLEQWMLDNRAEVVTAILTIARAWYVAGKPKAMNVPKLGTFTDWAKTIGGILEFVGIKDFQGNREDLRSKNNEEAQQWEAFLSVWHELYGSDWKSISDICAELQPAIGIEIQPSAKRLLEALPNRLSLSLADRPKGFKVALPVALGARVQTVFGHEGWRVEKEKNKHTCAMEWRVLQRVAEAIPAKRMNLTDDKNNGSVDTENRERNTIGATGEKPLQPSANRQSNFAENGTSHGSTSASNESMYDFQDGEIAEGSFSNAFLTDLLKSLMQHFDEKLKKQSQVMWVGPGTGFENGYVSKAKYVEQIKECWRSGDGQRVRAAVDTVLKKLGREESEEK